MYVCGHVLDCFVHVSDAMTSSHFRVNRNKNTCVAWNPACQ